MISLANWAASNSQSKFKEVNVVNWLQIGFAGNLKSRHDLRHRGTILLAGSKDP